MVEGVGASVSGRTPTPHTLHPIPYTLHPTPYTQHPTTYTLHPTPYTLHPTPYTLHHTPYTIHPEPSFSDVRESGEADSEQVMSRSSPHSYHTVDYKSLLKGRLAQRKSTLRHS